MLVEILLGSYGDFEDVRRGVAHFSEKFFKPNFGRIVEHTSMPCRSSV
jgi:hypothetical protein